jgi:hypothetical protein
MNSMRAAKKAVLFVLGLLLPLFAQASAPARLYCLAHDTSGYVWARLGPHARAALDEGKNIVNL